MKKRRTDKRVQKIFGIVCLSFLLGVLGGALAASMMPADRQGELSGFLQTAIGENEGASFWQIFWKYLKYDLIIWLGGWMQLGLFLSGAVFFFRSIAVGFTSAMLMIAYGVKGIWMAMTHVLPQNLLLIPTYVCIMSAAVYYMFNWQEGSGKGALKRERRRKQTEYCILLGISMIFVAAAAGIEGVILKG